MFYIEVYTYIYTKKHSHDVNMVMLLYVILIAMIIKMHITCHYYYFDSLLSSIA